MYERAMVETFLNCNAEDKNKINVPGKCVTNLVDFAPVSDDYGRSRALLAVCELVRYGWTAWFIFVIASCVERKVAFDKGV